MAYSPNVVWSVSRNSRFGRMFCRRATVKEGWFESLRRAANVPQENADGERLLNGPTVSVASYITGYSRRRR